MSGDSYILSIKQGRISSLVPGLLAGCRTGKVHSCFRTSLNLKMGDHLIHVGEGSHGLCCFGIEIFFDRIRQILIECRPDHMVVYKEDCLYIYGESRVFVLELDSFARIPLKIPRLVPGCGADSRLYQALAGEAEGLPLGLERDEAFCRHARAMTEASVRYFYGRGRGLTPAGDDILTGYGAVLQAFGKAETLTEALRNCTSQTTEVSKAYLYAMMKGYANERFIQLLLQVKEGDPEKIRSLTEQIKQTGSTSGCDTLYGMYLGLKHIKEDGKL